MSNFLKITFMKTTAVSLRVVDFIYWNQIIKYSALLYPRTIRNVFPKIILQKVYKQLLNIIELDYKINLILNILIAWFNFFSVYFI